MKPNRSSRFTNGLVCTYTDTPNRSFFFELDKEDRDLFQDISDFYNTEGLDYIVHRTGGGGFHFLSPTMISRGRWKMLHKLLEGINPKCPMTTLRIEPNKHVNEDLVWYNSHVERFNAEPSQNNENMCKYLNKIFGSDFIGSAAGNIKMVRYPLPLREGEIPL